jgi:hypothetical protein
MIHVSRASAAAKSGDWLKRSDCLSPGFPAARSDPARPVKHNGKKDMDLSRAKKMKKNAFNP